MKKTLLALFLCFSLFLFTGCIDLGVDIFDVEYDENGDIIIPEQYETDEEKEEYLSHVWSDGYDYSAYYDLFDSVTLITSEGDEKDVDVEDSLFNENTYTDETWGDGDTEIESNAYMLMAIKPELDVELNDFSLSFIGQGRGSVDIYFFILDEIPDNIPTYGDDAVNPVTDKDGNPVFDKDGRIIYEVDEYYYVFDFSSAVAHSTVSIGKSVSSANVSVWNTGERSASTVSINEGQYLVLLFYPNTGYGEAAGAPRVSFQPINMLFCIS